MELDLILFIRVYAESVGAPTLFVESKGLLSSILSAAAGLLRCLRTSNNFITPMDTSTRHRTLNPEERSRNPLNKSTAKMMYSFPKSLRFSQSLSTYPRVRLRMAPFYNLPNGLERRAAGFGYGRKTTFEDRRENPPPDSYKIRSDFGSRKHGISFGLGRSVTKKLCSALRTMPCS